MVSGSASLLRIIIRLNRDLVRFGKRMEQDLYREWVAAPAKERYAAQEGLWVRTFPALLIKFMASPPYR